MCNRRPIHVESNVIDSRMQGNLNGFSYALRAVPAVVSVSGKAHDLHVKAHDLSGAAVHPIGSGSQEGVAWGRKGVQLGCNDL